MSPLFRIVFKAIGDFDLDSKHIEIRDNQIIEMKIGKALLRRSNKRYSPRSVDDEYSRMLSDNEANAFKFTWLESRLIGWRLGRTVARRMKYRENELISAMLGMEETK